MLSAIVRASARESEKRASEWEVWVLRCWWSLLTKGLKYHTADTPACCASRARENSSRHTNARTHKYTKQRYKNNSRLKFNIVYKKRSCRGGQKGHADTSPFIWPSLLCSGHLIPAVINGTLFFSLCVVLIYGLPRHLCFVLHSCAWERKSQAYKYRHFYKLNNLMLQRSHKFSSGCLKWSPQIRI